MGINDDASAELTQRRKSSMVMPHSNGMSLHAISPSALSHHQVHVEIVLGAEGRLGVESLRKNRDRASTLYKARDRARRRISRGEDGPILKEKPVHGR